jgi:hypothetical protein
MNYVAGRRRVRLEQSKHFGQGRRILVTRLCGSRVTQAYSFNSNEKPIAMAIYEIFKDKVRKAHKKEMRKP